MKPIALARPNAAIATPILASASVLRVRGTAAVVVVVATMPSLHRDVADHHVMHEATEFVADDRVLARFGKGDRELAHVAGNRHRVRVRAGDLETVDHVRARDP